MKRACIVAVLVLGALGVIGPAPTTANSLWCQDGTTTEIERVLIDSPVKVAVAINPQGQVQVCYSTGTVAPGFASGAAGVVVTPRPVSPSASGIWVYCASDPGVRQPVNCDQHARTGATVTTSGTSVGTNGATIGIQIPFQVCAGSINSPGCTGATPNLSKTGLLIGGLTPIAAPPGATGAGYAVSSVEVWIDGTRVYSAGGAGAGAFADVDAPVVSVPTVGSSSPPCVIGGVCTPTLSGQLGFSGATETVTVVLPLLGTSTFPVTIPATCLVNFSGTC
ncbi:MAG TPA: hypothetical protein VF230_13230 [Acidimicrobiales bacterium]